MITKLGKEEENKTPYGAIAAGVLGTAALGLGARALLRKRTAAKPSGKTPELPGKNVNRDASTLDKSIKTSIDAISPEFKKSVDSGDLFSVRSVLTNYLVLNDGSFEPALAYARKHLQLFEPHESGAFSFLPKDKWNEQYFNEQKTDTMFNFSKERLDHLVDIANYIFPRSK